MKQEVKGMEPYGIGLAKDDTEFGTFLIQQVYGGEGNPFRHGTAQRAHVRDAGYVMVAAVRGDQRAEVHPRE